MDLSGVVAVARPGAPVRVSSGGGCTTATRFQVASVTKNLAAVLAMLLVEDGRLDLHEPIARRLPEAPPEWAGITLHHLLSNTSGIGHWPEIAGVDPLEPSTRDARFASVLHEPRTTAPGRFHYSSPGFLVAGVVMERAAGRPYARLLAERVLEPLGLTATVSGRRPSDVVAGHRNGVAVPSWSVASMVAAGDVCSTVADLLVYAEALDAGRLVSPESLAMMRTAHTTFDEPDLGCDGRLAVTGYGYGHFVGTFDGRPAAMHTGDNPGYRAMLGWFPGGVHVVAAANDDALDWDEVLQEALSGA
ncbi:serine hydrolase domain-containing protein [Dactylosporangium sp. CS-033363]|uniref:serine hydrolase domain-containing protein n=1 Tax=Dactylosporangium sp. CS-033363 TaxID=3239935 RepID=UPI003D910AA4